MKATETAIILKLLLSQFVISTSRCLRITLAHLSIVTCRARLSGFARQVTTDKRARAIHKQRIVVITQKQGGITDLYNNWIGGPASQADPTGSRLAAMLKHPKNIFAYSRKTTCVAVSTANFSDFFDFFSFRKGKLFVGWQSVAGMPSCAAYGCTNREERNKREKNTFHRYVFLYFYS